VVAVQWASGRGKEIHKKTITGVRAVAGFRRQLDACPTIDDDTGTPLPPTSSPSPPLVVNSSTGLRRSSSIVTW